MIRGGDLNESKFNEMVKKADESFITGDISVAKFYYAKALEIKANDTYVKDRMDVADQILRSTAARVDNREFDDALSKGDEAYSTKNYILARFFYRKALSLKSDSQIVKNKIEQTDSALNLDKSDSKNIKYDSNIVLADQAFQQQKYGLALNYYKQALIYKPREVYPLEQLSKIEGLMKK